jgi:hypothetical protein
MNSMVARQTLLMLGVVLAVGALLSFVFRGPGDVQAIWISGAVAVAVQVTAFSLGRVVGGGSLAARMGLGALIRFVALVTYALVVVFVIRTPATAALISLAAFFFLSTVIEPLLIK